MRSQKNKKKLMVAGLVAIVLAMIVYGYTNNMSKSLKEKESSLKQKETLLNDLKSKTGDIGSAINGPRGYALVAKGNLYTGTRIRPEMIEVKEVQLKDIENDVFQDAEALKGKVLLSNIISGQPILRKDLDLNSFDLPAGMRAITVPLEFIQGFSASIQVGSKIDVFSSGNNVVQLILQNIKILAFEKSAASSDSSGGSSDAPKRANVTAITMEIPAVLSDKIVNAISKGKISVLLRNSGDKTVLKPVVAQRPKIAQVPSFMPPSHLPPIPRGNFPFKGLKTLPDLPQPGRPTSNTQIFGPKVEVIKATEKQDVTFNNDQL